MKIKTDANGRILARVFPAPMTEQYYDDDGYITAPDSESATHFKNGELLTAPLKPNENSVFNETLFVWEYDSALAWADVRRRRDGFLSHSDWTQLPDVPLTTKEAWATYRQELRDITTQTDPLNIIWPTAPNS